jgi:glutaryl-CoA dehydrogenase (non-decarboxylating)
VIYHLTDSQRRWWHECREFADRVVAPRALAVDRDQALPRELIRELGENGWIGSMLPEEWGGAGLDATSYGMLSEELGRTCSNTRNFVAVQDMVADAILRWGSEDQRRRWLRDIASGRAVAAFLLTEPDVGSDAGGVATQAVEDGADIVINGTKKWISFGQCADVFLVFAQYDSRHTAFLVASDTPGVTVTALDGMLGLRGSMLGEITFTDCRIPPDSVVGRPGAGLVFVASSSLGVGRYSTAWGCVGLSQACLDASTAYAGARVQSGKRLDEQPLLQRYLADMVAESRAARLLCWQAGEATDRQEADAVHQTLIAKYFASRGASRASRRAVQLHGAVGMSAASPVGRLFRDAKAMEIIEGTTQVIQQLLGEWSGGATHPASPAEASLT